MELSSLRYFLCVANRMSFSRAAEQLYISQPSLSYHISNLEKELGTQLFIRDKRQIRLTEAGEILLDEAAQACGHVDAAIQRISSLSSPPNVLRFGFLELLITPCFNHFVAPYLRTKPELHGVMERAGWTLLDSMLLENNYDFIFTRDFMPSLHTCPGNLSKRKVMRDRISILVPTSYPCAEGDSICDLSPLNTYNLLIVDKGISGNAYDPFLTSMVAAHGYTGADQYVSVKNMDDLLGQVAAGRGFTVLPFHNTISQNYEGARLLYLDGSDVPKADVVLAWDASTMTGAKREYLSWLLRYFPEPLV